MKLYITLFLFWLSLFGFSQDLPKEPKVGKCYVRCRTDKGGLTEWRNFDCDLVRKITILKTKNLSSGVFNKKDRKVINRTLLKILKKGFKVELYSHYFSKNSDSINELRSIQNGKALLSYLQTQGIKSKQLLVFGYGNSKPLEKCLNLTSCSNYYTKNTRIEYRVVSDCLTF